MFSFAGTLTYMFIFSFVQYVLHIKLLATIMFFFSNQFYIVITETNTRGYITKQSSIDWRDLLVMFVPSNDM